MNVVERRHYFGLAIGSLWLIVVSAVFAALAFHMIGTHWARMAQIVELVVAGVLIAINAGIIIEIVRLPGGMGPRTSEGKVIGRRFGRIVVGEVIAIFVVNGVVSAAQHFDLIVPLDLIIVGIHFLPLAKTFEVPRYTWMGLLFCGICAVTLLFVPAGERIGGAAAWFVIPSLGCAAVASSTAAASLFELWRFLLRAASSTKRPKEFVTGKT